MTPSPQTAHPRWDEWQPGSEACWAEQQRGAGYRVDNQLQVVTATRPAQLLPPLSGFQSLEAPLFSHDLPLLDNLECCTLFLFLPITPSPYWCISWCAIRLHLHGTPHPTQRPANTPKNRRQRKGLECQNSCYEGWALSLQGRHQGLCSCLRSCLSVCFAPLKQS